MKKEREKFSITVALMLIEEHKVLLMKRSNTGYMDGYYGMIAGHVEEDESLSKAVIREAYEEVGISIKEEDVSVVCMVRKVAEDSYFNYFLTVKKYEGIPIIKEPHKCEELIWCDIDCLPENTIEAEKRAIYNYVHSISFDEY